MFAVHFRTMYKSLVLVLLAINVEKISGANILFISAVPTPSHHMWNRALAWELAKKGHNVTLIGPDVDKVNPENYTHILVKGLYEDFQEIDLNGMSKWSPLTMLTTFVEMSVGICKAAYNSQGLQTLLNYPPDYKFDLIIIDVALDTCLCPFIHRFNYPPTVAVTAFLLPSYVANNFGNHLYPAYIPWFGVSYLRNMSFMERFWNFFYTHADIIYRRYRFHGEEYEGAKKKFGEDLPPMEEIERHISLVLVNTDPILDQPQPLAPNFIPVGGLHTKKSNQIPQDLLSILDNAKNGVIVFSLGTNVRSDKLDESTQKALIEAFRKVPETVIWKFESDIRNLPKNVIVRKWLPQNDILGHPKVKLFIGHGGALSTQEAIFHGVPMICVPFFMDQHINTRNVVGRKLGIYLDFKKITTDYVLQKLREVLKNPIYTSNMKTRSKIFKDRTETPLERGIFWIEYAIRNGGAEFLNTPARDLPFYQASGLDIMGALATIVTVVLIVVYKLVKLILVWSQNKKKFKLN